MGWFSPQRQREDENKRARDQEIKRAGRRGATRRSWCAFCFESAYSFRSNSRSRSSGYAKTPATELRRFHILSGAIFPIYDKIMGSSGIHNVKIGKMAPLRM